MQREIDIEKYVFVFLAALVTAYVLTPLVRRLAVVIGMVDQPGTRRIHTVPIPRGGGLAVIVAFYVAMGLVGLCGWLGFAPHLHAHWLWRFSLAALVIVVIGCVDDWRGVFPLVKLVGQSVAGGIMFLGGCRIGTLFGIELPLTADVVLTVLWFLAVTNAFNLIDGLDGLAAGLAVISALGLTGALVIRHLSADSLAFLALAGACLGFLRYNFHPASVFLGDTGSTFIGFALAAMSLATASKSTFLAAFGVPLLAFGVPLFDTVLAVWRRGLRAAFPAMLGDGGQTGGVMQADAEHLHHRFLGYGLRQRQVAFLLFAINGALVLSGLLSLVFKAHAAGIVTLAFVAGVFVTVRHLAQAELWDTGWVLIDGLKRPSPMLVASILYPVADFVALSVALLLTLRIANVAVAVGNIGTRWVNDLPIWVAPAFLGLLLAGAHSRVWSRARMSDYLVLGTGLVAGTAVGTGLSLLVGSEKGGIRFAGGAGPLAFLGLSALFVIGGRMWMRGLRELMAVMVQRRVGQVEVVERVLICGAGFQCRMFLSNRAASLGKGSRPGTIVGIVDEDPNLRKRQVYGYRVIGTPHEIRSVIRASRVDRIVLTELLAESSRADVMQAAREAGVRVSEWRCEERTVDQES